MSKSRAESRRKRVKRSDETSSIWIDRAWRFMARPQFVGVLMIVAGAVVALAPTAGIPREITSDWWVTAYRFADALQGASSLLAVAAVASLALFAVAWLERRSGGRAALLPLVGVGLMGSGLFVGCSVWLLAQTSLPSSQVAIAPGETMRSFGAVESGRAFKVMLPTGVHLVSVSPDEARAVLELRGAGAEEGVRYDVFVGDPLRVEDFRFALVGIEIDRRVRSAVIGREDGIDVRATAGSEIRFTPDGPRYQVRQVVIDYLGVMGPAVELESEESGRFWVFERDAGQENPLHEIRLRRLETSLMGLFVVSKTGPGGGGGAAISTILFVLGLAMFLFVSDPRPGSLNELGPRRESA